ncbi:MAG TPA: gamma-glutamylcyclotransferase family protein [Burkholderiaceae bacterium]|nr:gamma-glutamylcyclotransferase family protein [Burkholderiaceae bacterium]
MPEAPVHAAAVRHVFVYGTLRRGDDNDITKLQPAPRFVGPAAIAGTMYHLGGYPGVVLGGSGTVVGEVYAIEPALERVLDEIEELYPQQTDEYFKRSVCVEVGAQRIDCMVYEINPRYAAGARTIPGGDWVRGRHG